MNSSYDGPGVRAPWLKGYCYAANSGATDDGLDALAARRGTARRRVALHSHLPNVTAGGECQRHLARDDAGAMDLEVSS